MKSVGLVAMLALVFAPSALAIEVNDFGDELGFSEESLETQIVDIIQWILGFLALIAVIMIIYGGFVWLTAAGNEERIASAKKVISAAIIGLVIILLAWAIVWFVTQGVLNQTTG